jgi:hypothetical protein
MARYFGARGCVSEQQRKKMDDFLAKYRQELATKERARIARLSDRDIQKIAARKIVEAARRSGSVTRRDLHQGGIPDHRIDSNLAQAFALARRMEPMLDAMGATP